MANQDINVNDLDTVTREFEWNIESKNLPNAYYNLSQYFDIFWENDTTKWQIILYRNSNKLYAQLKKIKSNSINYVVDLTFKTNSNVEADKIVKKELDGKYGASNWFFAINLDYIYVSYNETSLILQIKMSLNKAKDVENGEVTQFLSNYEKLLNSKKLSDFKFVCSDGKEIPTHRFVLIAHSPVMYKMLMAPMIESKTHTAKLDDIDGETMLEVLRFLYIRKVENIGNVGPNLLYCAEKYELNELKSYAGALMCKNLSIDNVFEYYELANRYKEEELLEKCVIFIRNNYQTLKAQEAWNNFDPNMKTLLKYFVKNDYENSVYVLKTLKTYYYSDLPRNYTLFQ